LFANFGRGLRVLLAEDHITSVEMLRSILDLGGCELTVVGRGDSAVECVQAGEFDLVLMDVQMPGMDGLAAMRAIRNLPTAAARTPIVALTAMALWGDRERCLEAGANDYVSKPIDLDRLFEVMQLQLDLARDPGLENAPSPT
jgi:CheY-like chemotaxis protein